MHTQGAANPTRPARPWWRVAVFLLLFGGALALYRSPWGAPLERILIERFTVPVAAAVIDTMHPGVGVRAEGSRLVAPGGGLNVRHGCEGSDLWLLLAAALAVAPLAWRWRLAGMLCGALWLFLLNQARIVALFHAYRYEPAAFATLHGLLAPLVMVAGAALAFAAWMRWAAPSHRVDTSAP